MDKLFAPFLPPWAETGLQPAFYDMESGTVLQQTARMYSKVQQLTRLFNELSEETKTTVEEYIAKFVELKDFVDNYFDNLDVQEEINNKLDAMAEAGTLSDIISEYLNSIAIFGYDTVALMKTATNFVEGSFAKTMGYYTKDDTGGALYRIRKITNDDTIDESTIIEITGDPTNTLIAEIVPQEEMYAKQFGVKGDGTIDDSDKIQIALDYCSGKVLHFGNYTCILGKYVSTSNNIIEGDNVTLKAGTGYTCNYMLIPHAKLTINNVKLDANNQSICCIGESNDNTYLSVDNCEFTGTKRNVDGTNFALNSAIYVCATESVIINSNIHDNLSHGLRLKAKVSHTIANIENCQFNRNGSKTEGNEVKAVGLVQYGGENGTYYDKCTITNCYATGNANTGIAPHSVNNVVIDSCVCTENGEHGICLMDGKNGIISNCICDNNLKYGIRIQGDYSTSDAYHGYKNCIITGCMTKGSGIDIDEYIDTIKISDNILTYYDTGTTESIKGIRIGRSDNQTHYVKNANIVNNYFYGFASFPIQVFIPLDNSNIFLNYVDGTETKFYKRGKDMFRYSTCSLIECGTSDNILSYPTDLSHWTTVSGSSVTDNVITRGTDDLCLRYTQSISSKPRFVSLITKISNYDDDANFGIGFRFRDSNNRLCSSDYYQLLPVYGQSLFGSVIDLTKVTGLNTTDLSKVEVCIYLSKGSVKVDYCYCALTNDLPILPNTIV